MKKTVRIGGMSCPHCSARVEKVLLALPGTEKVEVDLGKATALYSGSATDAEIKKAVEDAGYEVTSIE